MNIRFAMAGLTVFIVLWGLDLHGGMRREHAQNPKSSVEPGASAMDRKVAALIEKTMDSKTEQRAFAELEALGCKAVPAIINRMDDGRNLPDPHISLRNKSPQAFEGMRHYGPQKVVDALAAILNQITGEDFGFIYNGATDDERKKAVQGWRDFLRQTPSSRLCDKG